MRIYRESFNLSWADTSALSGIDSEAGLGKTKPDTFNFNVLPSRAVTDDSVWTIETPLDLFPINCPLNRH